MAGSLTYRTLSAAIVDRLRGDILSGAYGASDQLRQDALAAQFGVSRIPVREALFQLEAEGFVQIVPHKGAIVTGFSVSEVEDVFDLRVSLECRLLRDSIPRLSDDDIARMDAARRAFDDAIEGGDMARSGRLNAAFHMAMYAAADRPKTHAIVAGLLQTSERYTRLQLSSAGSLAKAGREHRELVDLCRKRRVTPAVKQLAAHIEEVRGDLVGILARGRGVGNRAR